VNEEAKLELMAAVTHNNRKPVWRIELESGRHVEATANHPFRVLNERGRIVWRTVKDLEEGDVMVSALFGAETATGGSDLSEDEAVLLGYLVAEGTLGHANRHKVAFTNAHDDDVLAEYRELMEHVLDVDPVRIQTYGGKEHHVHDTAVRRRLADDYGLAYAGSAAKEIPHCVRTAGAKVQRAFLSALYEGDGWIEKGPEVGYTSASRTLAEQVQLLLFGLGVPCSLRTRHDASLDRDYHTVLVPPGSVARFLEQVGFRSARRAQPTFDVMVPGTHSFLANGVLSHNTTVALHAIAEAQKAGGVAAFIDAEHALDPIYAAAIGVDMDALLVSQPDTGEQALEITDTLVRSGAIDLLVIDSVAALTPRAEIEGEMGDSHVGLQARLMSQALRKLSGNLHKSRTCCIFINQLREKIGVMFGCFRMRHQGDPGRRHPGEDRQDRQPADGCRGPQLQPRHRRHRTPPDRRVVRQRPDRGVPPVHRRQALWQRAGAVRGHRQPSHRHAHRMAGGRGDRGRRPRPAGGDRPVE
jgi:hypothetical protein